MSISCFTSDDICKEGKTQIISYPDIFRLRPLEKPEFQIKSTKWKERQRQCQHQHKHHHRFQFPSFRNIILKCLVKTWKFCNINLKWNFCIPRKLNPVMARMGFYLSDMSTGTIWSNWGLWRRPGIKLDCLDFLFFFLVDLYFLLKIWTLGIYILICLSSLNYKII